MRSRMLFASIVTACLLAAGSGELAPAAQAGPAGPFSVNSGDGIIKTATESRRRGRGLPLFIGPNTACYDYPYYFSRGRYSTHIGPGCIYYGEPYRSSYRAHRGSRDKCASWKRRCAANWGYDNADYDGCLAYHGC